MRLSELDSNFEKYMFGSFRRKPEEDTTYEDTIFNMLVQYINNPNHISNDTIFPKFINAMNILLDLKSQYPDVLQPRATRFFRGFSLNFSQFYKMNWNVQRNWCTVNGQYKPLKYVEGWTSNLNIALNFAVSGSEHSELPNKEIVQLGLKDLSYQRTHDGYFITAPVIVSTSDKSKMIFNGGFMNRLSMNEIGLKEFEHLRVDPKVIDVQYAIPTLWYKQLIKPF